MEKSTVPKSISLWQGIISLSGIMITILTFWLHIANAQAVTTEKVETLEKRNDRQEEKYDRILDILTDIKVELKDKKNRGDQ